MVNVKQKDLEKAIKMSKFLIKHHEKHGNGIDAMSHKSTLKKQERKLELRLQK